MKVRIGNITIGDGEQIAIQSMTNTDTRDYVKTAYQVNELTEAGADIVRCTVPDSEAAKAIAEIKKRVKVPIVADIHFDYRLAIEAVLNGADKVRINPGNIGAKENVKKVVDVLKEREIPIRIGVNGGSVPKDIYAKFGKITPEALLLSAKRHIDIVNEFGYDNIVVSVKSSDPKLNFETNKLLRKETHYPLHIGVTEAGTEYGGIIKSSVGIGALLLNGIGDTIRVSLTDNPVKEIRAAKEILKASGYKLNSPEFISCPTCGRTKIDLIKIADKVEKAIRDIKKPIKVAVMGCVVNGPGEAKEADIGIAGGVGCAVLFKKGEIIKKIKEEDIVPVLLEEIDKM